jgi:hypothetical protein
MRDNYSLLPLRASSNFNICGGGTVGNSLQVTNSLAVDAAAANADTVAKTLRFSGEVIASRRKATPLPSNSMPSSPGMLTVFGHREKLFSTLVPADFHYRQFEATPKQTGSSRQRIPMACPVS